MVVVLYMALAPVHVGTDNGYYCDQRDADDSPEGSCDIYSHDELQTNREDSHYLFGRTYIGLISEWEMLVSTNLVGGVV